MKKNKLYIIYIYILESIQMIPPPLKISWEKKIFWVPKKFRLRRIKEPGEGGGWKNHRDFFSSPPHWS